MESLSEKLMLARKKAKLSQESLAKKIGKSHVTISRWESGAGEPSISELEEICIAVGQPLSYFSNVRLAEPSAAYLSPDITEWLADPAVKDLLSSPQIREALRHAGKNKARAKEFMEDCLRKLPDLTDNQVAALKAILAI